jgi:predicted nucleic acid-binding protein
MSANVFLDTNLFVYEAGKRFPEKQVVAAQIIAESFQSTTGTISFQVVQEFFSVAFRRFNPPMTPSEAEEYLIFAFAQFRCVHSSYFLYQRALQLSRRFALSWYDSLIVAAALEGDCGILYTEDLQHGQTFDTLRVVNPFL